MNLDGVNLGELGRQLLAKLLQATASEGGLDEVREQVKATGKEYTDDTFPSTQSSLITDWKDPEVQDKVQRYSKFVWMRAKEIPSIKEGGVNIQVFADSIDPSDIKQGLLGDCYFLSTLSVLAEVPDRVKKIFVTQGPNDEGVYAVKISHNGEFKEVTVSDSFPCYQGAPAFSKSEGDELWVMILEKAYAKMHGSYERIEGGFAENCLRDLTGAPCDVLSHEDEDIFSKVMEAEENMWIMAASAGTTEASKENLEKLGLVGQHSYGLLSAKEVKLDNGESAKLVQLRNPWGNFEWAGDWGDSSELWTPQLKRQVNFNDADDGSFWMCLEDFIHYFSKVQVCRIQDNFKYSSF